MPLVPESFIQEMKRIDRGLFVLWDQYFERFQVMHKDSRTGLIRCIIMIEDEDGSFRPCDNRTLEYLRQNVSWETLNRFPSPKEMGDFLRGKRIDSELKAQERRNEYRKLWNKEHRKYWRAAMDNARRGVLASPSRTKERIIIASGLSPKASKGTRELGLFD